MPDIIEKNIGVFERFVQIYKNEVKDDLDHEAKELVKRLKKVIDQHSQTYNLETQNDVNPIKYYSLKYRIKGEDSLKEKLVRKNEGFKITEVGVNNDPEEVQTKKNIVIPYLKRFPDAIGVRIVTELRYDCNKVLALLRSFVDDLDATEVVLDKLDLEAQPQKMKNGLFIYKIKGVFRSDFGFELQIKSKIEEAWGDMDHAIFYKDYSASPIKNITQVTMNNVGKLLENIDELLLGLRNSSSQYQENLEQLANLKSLNDELFPLIKQKLGISFEIGKVASFLNTVKEKALEGIGSPKVITSLDCSFLDFEVTDKRLLRYVEIRKKSFELMIIEAAYFNWSTQNGKPELTQASYEVRLIEFLDTLTVHIFNVIEKENSAQAAELVDSANLAQKITVYSKYMKTHDLFLSEKTLIHISQIEGTIEEFFQEKQDTYFIEDIDYSKLKTAFKVLYAVKSFGYSDSQAMDDLLEIGELLDGNIDASLDNIAYDFKEFQRKNERNTRADQKKGEIVKESIPTINISESVVNNLKLKLNA